MGLTDSNNCISNNLRADIMRSSMENKNLLSDKGSIYVGTGEQNTVGGTSVAKTKSLPLGESGKVLISKGGDLSYGALVDGENRTTTHDGFSLKQDTETGQLTLGGHINQVVREDGATSVTSDGKFYGKFHGEFYTDSGEKDQLNHVYHHHIEITENSSSSYPEGMKGAKIAIDFINGSSEKYDDEGIAGLSKINVGYYYSEQDGDIIDYYVHLIPSGVYVPDSTGVVIIGDLCFFCRFTHAVSTDSSLTVSYYWNGGSYSKKIVSFQIKDTVTAVDKEVW